MDDKPREEEGGQVQLETVEEQKGALQEKKAKKKKKVRDKEEEKACSDDDEVLDEAIKQAEGERGQDEAERGALAKAAQLAIPVTNFVQGLMAKKELEEEQASALAQLPSRFPQQSSRATQSG